jgi:hypothetical protein
MAFLARRYGLLDRGGQVTMEFGVHVTMKYCVVSYSGHIVD